MSKYKKNVLLSPRPPVNIGSEISYRHEVKTEQLFHACTHADHVHIPLVKPAFTWHCPAIQPTS